LKVSEIVMRCVKARFVSWITNSQVNATVPTLDGSGVILAVYVNGRAVQLGVEVPDSPADLWGPDGPVNMTPAEEPEEEDDDGEG
jgi:hypothetical protein